MSLKFKKLLICSILGARHGNLYILHKQINKQIKSAPSLLNNMMQLLE